ncbi:MAG: translation initiation inhibitor [Prevotella sp.]|nr:translation initiation inhibitor [Prevotella sp.]
MYRYNIFAPKGRGHFIERLGELYLTIGRYLDQERAEGRQLRFAKIFLSDAQNQYKDLTESTLFAEILAHVPTSIIEQPPLDGSKISILLKTSTEEMPFLFHSIRLSEEETRGANSYIQTMLIFNKYLEKMKELGLTLKEHCVRTWIYVADIDVNYEGMVRARNDIFRNQGLTPETHFIASTGIGGFSQTRSESVAIDFLTYPKIKESDKKYLQALDHLNPTHEYGVSFERGTRLQTTQGHTFFISGTASIDKHGKALYVGDIHHQTGRLLENISALLHDGGATMRDVQYFYVYLRDPSDRDEVEALLQKAYPDIPHVLLQGKVCRPEWLVEMECVAYKNN